jgi:hypothetical protein
MIIYSSWRAEVVERFDHDDAAYRAWVEQNRGSWIATVYLDKIQVHREGCGQLSGVHGQFTTYPKWCSHELPEIEEAAAREGKEVRRNCTSLVCR